MDFRLAFADVEWEPTLAGTARLKRIARGRKTFRLVEMTPRSEHPEWCETGHVGLIVDGDLEIDFDGEIETFRAGDALSIPHGRKFRHRPRALTDRAVMFLIEDDRDV